MMKGVTPELKVILLKGHEGFMRVLPHKAEKEWGSLVSRHKNGYRPIKPLVCRDDQDGNGQTFDGHGRNMLMLAERKEGACWMQPDAEITQHVAETGHINTGSTSISSNHTNGANFGIRDGSVNFMSQTMSSGTFTGLVRGSDVPPP
jgi:hypothetical protein